MRESGSFITAVDARALSRVPDVAALLGPLRKRGFPWWLDSATRGERLARFSFAGADPYGVLRLRGGNAELECLRDVRPDLAPGTARATADPFELVRSLLAPLTSAAGSRVPPVPFAGGAVGYFGYELANASLPIALQADDDIGTPDLALLFVDRLIAIDHPAHRAWAIGLGFGEDEQTARTNAQRASADFHAHAEVVARTAAAKEVRPRATVPLSLDAFSAHFTGSSYGDAVETIREQIAAGNVYQANLTQRMDLPLRDTDPFDLYRELRALNPAPFAAYLELPEAAILSSSPERFLRLDPTGAVESRPIKGTRPRAASRGEDERLREELRRSEKDRAENLMIVDLVRNDLGRVCEIGSIEVPELMIVESYATVFQLVSTVTGRLRPDQGVIDLVRAAFPPGSMTGAPKLAATALIDQLEPVRRGIYSGGLGYLDFRGGCDLSVVIRTLIVAAGRAYLHVGGGIVADSEPEAEYRETLDKAQALLAALARFAPASEETRGAVAGSV